MCQILVVLSGILTFLSRLIALRTRKDEKERARQRSKEKRRRQCTKKDAEVKPASSNDTPHFDGELPDEFVANQAEEVRQNFYFSLPHVQ